MVKNVTTRPASLAPPPSAAPAADPGFALPRVSAAATANRQPQTSTSGSLDDVGQRLGDMRRALGMTQLEVAFKMGTTQPALARLEKGDAKANLRTLSRYAEALGRRAVVQLTLAPGGGRPDVSLKDAAAKETANRGTADTSVRTRTFDLEALPSALAAMRKESGVTQSQVASRMATTQPVIARLESGDGIPNLTTLERFSQAIGASLGVAFETPV
jgi:transcriptional regulator with XRE-family HTH domain